MGCKDFFVTLVCAVGTMVVKAQSADTLVVHFDFNKAVLLPPDRHAIDKRIDRPGSALLSVGLSGFCDSIGDNRYNDSLSMERIAAVKTYLRTKGMPDTLFKALQPYGKRKPLNDNADEEKRSLNRRVLIVWRREMVAPAPDTSMLTGLLRDSAAFVGKTILVNIQFYEDMHHPMPSSFRMLRWLTNFMKAHPGLRVEIQGYVCCMPATMDGYDIETKNQDLSVQRAKFVYAYLATHGIDTKRMSFKGFGGADKIYPDEINKYQMLINRRVEMKILAWDRVN